MSDKFQFVAGPLQCIERVNDKLTLVGIGMLICSLIKVNPAFLRLARREREPLAFSR